MPQFLRAITLALAMLVAHVWHVVPHGAASAPRSPEMTSRPHSGVAAVRRIRALEAHLEAAEAPPPRPIASVYVAHRAPAPPRYSGSISQIIQQAFAPLGQAAVGWAERVAMCESGDNPYARNPDGASGLFQFMPSTWAGTPYASSSVFDPVANARAAAWLYARRGASAWSCG